MVYSVAVNLKVKGLHWIAELSNQKCKESRFIFIKKASDLQDAGYGSALHSITNKVWFGVDEFGLVWLKLVCCGRFSFSLEDDLRILLLLFGWETTQIFATFTNFKSFLRMTPKRI